MKIQLQKQMYCPFIETMADIENGIKSSLDCGVQYLFEFFFFFICFYLRGGNFSTIFYMLVRHLSISTHFCRQMLPCMI